MVQDLHMQGTKTWNLEKPLGFNLYDLEQVKLKVILSKS